MPYFTAKKRCFYNGAMHEKGAVAEFFEPVSAESWEPMDEDGQELLVHPEGGEQKADAVTVSGEKFAELQGVHESFLADFNRQQERIMAIEQERDNAINSVLVLQKENESLAKSGEAACLAARP